MTNNLSLIILGLTAVTVIDLGCYFWLRHIASRRQRSVGRWPRTL